jgi:hypothetical protein
MMTVRIVETRCGVRLATADVVGMEQRIEPNAIETNELTTKRKEESRPALAPIVSMILTSKAGYQTTPHERWGSFVNASESKYFVAKRLNKEATIMTSQTNILTPSLIALICLIVALMPATASGHGSMDFNGGSTEANTSKLQNNDADVLNGSKQLTVSCWIKAEGKRENGLGYVFLLDEEEGDAAFLVSHYNIGNNTLLISKKAPAGDTIGLWTIPITGGAWNAISVSLDFSGDNAPTARFNFASTPVTPVGAGPSGIDDQPASGYCVGNNAAQTRTWDGQIAHVQVLNRILSTTEMDACLRSPGSIADGLRLWLPMSNPLDIHDRSGHNFHGTATDLATGAIEPMLVKPLGAPARGAVRVDTGYTKINQYVIPRYGDGTNHPAAQVMGSGSASTIQGTTYGNMDGSNPQEIVVTEDYDNANGIDGWINDSGGGAPAVCQPELRDLTIAGKEDVPGYGEGSIVTNDPGLDNPAYLYKQREVGAFIRGNGSLVENVRFFHIAGRSCVIEKGGGTLNGPILPWDREKVTLRNLWMIRCYAGLEINAIDTIVGNVTCDRVRDYGVKFSQGAAQIDGAMHLYGVSSYPWAHSDVTPAPAAWFVAGAGYCWGGPWYVETSDIGMKIEYNSNGHVIGPIYSHNCKYGNIQVFGAYTTIRDFEITANASVAMGNANGGSAYTIQLDTDSTFATDSLNGLRVVITSGTGADQSRTITDYQSSTKTATVSPNWITPPTAGSGYAIMQAPGIDIAGQENTIINGRIGSSAPVPDGVVAVRLTNGTRQTIRDLLIFGTANSSAPLLSVEGNGSAVLNDSVIVAKCYNAGTFLELYPTMARGTAQGTVPESETTTIKLATSESFPDDWLNGAKIIITGGPGDGQERLITDYVGSTDTATVSPSWTTNPTSSSTYEVRVNRLGTGNYIWLTTAGTVPTPVNFPPIWDSATNEIWVDGDRKP